MRLELFTGHHQVFCNEVTSNTGLETLCRILFQRTPPPAPQTALGHAALDRRRAIVKQESCIPAKPPREAGSMTVITTRLTVSPEGAISSTTPLPVGEYTADVTVVTPAAGRPFTMVDFPVHDEPWDASISLRREDLYDDEGRLRG